MTHQKFFQDGYQQALDDFDITQLLSQLSKYCDADFDAGLMALEEQELENLAAILIGQLIQALNGKLIASYLNAIRHGNLEVFNCPIDLEFPKAVDLPSEFPNTALPPRFLYGDKLHLISVDSDTELGVVIGRFYNYAAHRCRWMWRYILWLDKNSFSASWIVATAAWEEDLQPYVEEV
jgi:hypothetical protein